MSEVEKFLNSPNLEKIGSAKIEEPRHPDFEKIYRQFIKRYCGNPEEECERGKRAYYAWLKTHGLDDTKPYRRPQEMEAFKWAEPLIKFAREDEDAKYYRVEALFPVSSMNRNIYTEDELIRAARTLIGKPVNMNHETPPLEGVEIIDAEYEDGAVEVLLKVSRNAEFKGQKIIDMIDNGEVLHVSIEGACRNRKFVVTDGEVGFGCEGLVLTGLALLQKDVLPGVPLTRLEPVEKILSDIDEVISEETWESEWDTAFINRLPDAAFAVIEPAYLRGETGDKRCRHLPHHKPSVKSPDEDESVDIPHLRNALARCGQIKPLTDSISVEELRRRAREHLLKHAKALLPSHQEEEREKPKTPCESAKESLLARLECLEAEIPQILQFIPRMLLLEDRVKRLEEIIAGSTEKEESDKESSKILTKEGFWKRFRELRREGLSKSDAYRLTAMEALKAIAKKKR